MELYPLLLADHPNWHRERDYSPQVRSVLVRALRALDRSRHRELAFARVYALVRPLLDAPMCLHQRLRLSYVAARARAARSEDHPALHWLDETLNLESELGDTADLAQIHFQRGGIYRRLLRFNLASHAHRRALMLQSDDPVRARYFDSTFTIQILSQLAIFEFYQGHYWIAKQYVEQAYSLLPYMATRSLAAGTLRWIQALLDRWSGNSWEALEGAHAAARMFVDLGDSSSADRIMGYTAECALDIAQRLDVQGSECARLLAVAHEYLKAAHRLAASDHDENGLVLTELGMARWSRIARRNDTRRDTLQRLLAQAYQLDDEILIAQSYTMLGDELAFQEERESAKNCYRDALNALERTDSPAAGVWAWRSLRFPEEWLVN